MGITPNTRITLQEAVELYVSRGMENYSRKAKASIAPTISRLFQYFEKQCGRKYLNEIVDEDFLKLRSILKDAGFKGKAVKGLTINRYQKWLITACNWFIKKKFIFENPFSKVQHIRLAKSEKVRGKSIPLDEWIRIVTAPMPEGFGFDIRPLVVFATATGIRRDDLFHLQWRDIDLIKGEIKICVKNDCPTRAGMGWEPKWKVEANPPLNNIARRVLASIEKHDEVWGDYKVGNQKKEMTTDFVFARNVKGKYRRIDTIRNAWKRLLENAGLGGKYQFKDLRATSNDYFQTYCLMSTKESATILRHNADVNWEHYTPTIPSEIKKKADKLPPEMEEAVKAILPFERTIH